MCELADCCFQFIWSLVYTFATHVWLCEFFNLGIFICFLADNTRKSTFSGVFDYADLLLDTTSIRRAIIWSVSWFWNISFSS